MCHYFSHAIVHDFTNCEMINITIIYKIYNYNAVPGMGAYTASDESPTLNSGLATLYYRKDCAKQGLRNRVILV